MTFDFNFAKDAPFIDEEDDVIAEEPSQSRIKKIRTFSQTRGKF